MEKYINNRFVKLLLISGAVYFFLKFICPILAPALIAILFLAMFGPFLKKLQQKIHINRQIGAVVLLVLGLAIFTIIIWIISSWLIGSLPNFWGTVENYINQAEGVIHSLCKSIARITGAESGYLEDWIMDQITGVTNNLQNKLLPGMFDQTLIYIKIILSCGGFLIVFIVVSVLLAKDYDELMTKMIENEDFHIILEVLCGIVRYLATYLKAQLLIMTMIGVVSALFLSIFGVEYGILWGILAGVLDALPFIGTGIVFVPLAIVQIINGAYYRAAVCAVLYVVCIIIREFAEPKLIGGNVGISPAAILASMYAGIKLFGIAGIVEGPLGLIIIIEAYKSMNRNSHNLVSNS